MPSRAGERVAPQRVHLRAAGAGRGGPHGRLRRLVAAVQAVQGVGRALGGARAASVRLKRAGAQGGGPFKGVRGVPLAASRASAIARAEAM